LCLAKKDYIRAQILARKISPRAFQKQQGDSKGEIGIEGTAIEEADKVCKTVRRTQGKGKRCCVMLVETSGCDMPADRRGSAAAVQRGWLRCRGTRRWHWLHAAAAADGRVLH
jgi:hypothetical protein